MTRLLLASFCDEGRICCTSRTAVFCGLNVSDCHRYRLFPNDPRVLLQKLFRSKIDTLISRAWQKNTPSPYSTHAAKGSYCFSPNQILYKNSYRTVSRRGGDSKQASMIMILSYEPEAKHLTEQKKTVSLGIRVFLAKY